jgi:hypothetical protein
MNDIINEVLEKFYKWSKLKAPPPEPKPTGNANLDDPEGHRDANLTVDQYFMAEVVAVPPDFEITNHLKMREAAGIFDHKDVNLRQLVTVSMAVRATPIFSVLNNPLINPFTCMYFLNIMGELKLIINSVNNPIRRNQEEYTTFLKRWNKDRHTYVRGQDVLRMNFIIINLVPLYAQKVVDEAVNAVKSVVEHTQDVRQMKEKL